MPEAFSVQATKNLSGVEGGFVVSDDPEVAAAARRIRTYGEDIADGSDLGGWYFRPYTVFSVGWNYRSNECPRRLRGVSFADWTSTRPSRSATVDSSIRRWVRSPAHAPGRAARVQLGVPQISGALRRRTPGCRCAADRVPWSAHGRAAGRRGRCRAVAHPARDVISDPSNARRLRTRLSVESGARRCSASIPTSIRRRQRCSIRRSSCAMRCTRS